MTGLTRWDPFAEMAKLQDSWNWLFDFGTRNGLRTAGNFSPPVDIYEDAEGITLRAELPGVDPADVEVKIEDDTLTISGSRKLEKEDKRENYHRIERTFGSFMRSFSLPAYVDVDKVKATNRNGVLEIFLPRKPESKPRKIDVRVH